MIHAGSTTSPARSRRASRARAPPSSTSTARRRASRPAALGKLIVALEDHGAARPRGARAPRHRQRRPRPAPRAQERVARDRAPCDGRRALHSPDTGVVDFQASPRLRRRRRGLGRPDHHGRSTSPTRATPTARVRPPRGRRVAAARPSVRRRLVRRARGLTARRREPRILPFRGDWLKIRLDRRDLVNGWSTPCRTRGSPSSACTSRRVDDEVLIGPTALLALRARRLPPTRRHAARPPLDAALARDLSAGPAVLADGRGRDACATARRPAMVTAPRATPRRSTLEDVVRALPACGRRPSAATAR